MRALAAIWAVMLVGCPSKPDPTAQADGLYLAGQTAFLQGDFATAHAHFAEVKKLAPNDARLPAAVGEVFLAQMKLAEALEQFRVVAKAEPGRATTWSRIGFILALQGKPEEAREALTRALSLNPQDFNALEQIAELDLELGKLEPAVKGWVAAAEAAPNPANVFFYLRASGELSKRDRHAEALAVLEKAAASGVKASELLSELGDLLVRAGRLSDAVRAYRDAASTSTDPTLWELVGELEARLERPLEAEAAFRKSLSVKDRGVVHVALARLCLTRKDEPCAQQELTQAMAKATGEEVRETLDLADLLVAMKRKADALTLLASLSEEAELAKDTALQLKVARLAKELGKKEIVSAACARAQATDAGVTRCP
ncbi:MAG: tetratricopeptide repeat protein [Myxococcota bacterium]